MPTTFDVVSRPPRDSTKIQNMKIDPSSGQIPMNTRLPTDRKSTLR
jgi:hypothetical protein